MDNNNFPFFPENIAKAVSVIFHPLFMPLYAMIIIFTAPTLYGYLPFDVKRLLFLIVAVNNVVLPMMLMPFFKYRNIISSYSIDERSERLIPLMVTTLLYSFTSYLVTRFPLPLFLKSFFISAFLIALVVTIVTFWWKISVHAVSAGALIALVFVLSFRMYTPLAGYQAGVILVSGLVLSSRLRLNSHSPAQVWAGLTTGILGFLLCMMIFK